LPSALTTYQSALTVWALAKVVLILKFPEI
jgi:hypothetical protein